MKPETVLGDQYRLERRVGSGPTGIVWRAFDMRRNRAVTVKILHPQMSDTPELRQQFRGNALMVSRLRCPGIPQILDTYEEKPPGEDSTISYVVTDYVDAKPLSSLIARRKNMDADNVLPIIANAAQTLHTAHCADIVHANIKPQNILIGTDDTIIVTDFGVVSSATSSSAYQSPEQRDGLPLTPASDVYSLGAIAYECLTGFLPGPAHEPMPPLPTGTSSAVSTLLAQALRADPSERFESAELLAAECRQIDYATSVLGPLLFGLAGNEPTTPADSPLEDSKPGPTADVAESVPDAGNDNDAPGIMPVMLTSPRKAAPEQSPVAETSGDKNHPPIIDKDQPTRSRRVGVALLSLFIAGLLAVSSFLLFSPDQVEPDRTAVEQLPDKYGDPTDSNDQSSVAPLSSDSPSPSKDPSPTESSNPDPTRSNSSPPATTPKPQPTSSSPSSNPPPPKVDVPNVIGMSSSEASSTLTGQGLQPSIVESGTGDESCPVHGQHPPSGTSVDEGSTVTVKVRKVADTADCDGNDDDPTENPTDPGNDYLHMRRQHDGVEFVPPRHHHP